MKQEQLLRDESIKPTDTIIANGLGAANNSYLQFIKELKKHDIEIDWRYYNDGKSWLGKALYKWTTTRGTKKEITVFWLSIWNGFFKVSMYIPERVRTDALTLKLSSDVINMIEISKPMGKLKFFPIIFDLKSNELFNDIYMLVDFKKTIK